MDSILLQSMAIDVALEYIIVSTASHNTFEFSGPQVR